jgi:hypothetical protein
MDNYREFVEEAILILAEPKGSTTKSLWKCIKGKHPEAEENKFKVALKRCKDEYKNEPTKSDFIYEKKTRRLHLRGEYIVKLEEAAQNREVPVKRIKKSDVTLKKKHGSKEKFLTRSSIADLNTSMTSIRS